MASALPELLSVLEERDIPLGRDDIAWAFDHAETKKALTAWISEYLTPQTLLTKAELQFAEVHHHATSLASDSGKARPLSDLEIEAAIDSLEASTAAIDTQCRALEAQKTFLKRLSARHTAQVPEPDQSPTDIQQKKFVRERAQAGLEADELAQNLGSRLQSATKQVETVRHKATTNVERLLEKDDRLLGGLQKVVPRLGDLGDQIDDTDELERLCSALSALIVKEIHARLNATYTTTLSKHSQLANGSDEDGLSAQQTKQRETLQAELEELSSEIEGLVTIAIDNKYRKPLKRAMKTAQAENRDQKLQWFEYTTMTLQWLAARMEILNEHIQHIHGHNDALRTIADTLHDVSKAARRNTEAAGGAPAAMEKASVKGLKPLRLVQANLPEAQDPILQLLRQLDVRVSDANGAMNLSDTLGPVVVERREKLLQLMKATEDAITEAITSSLFKTDAHLHDLLAAVYAPTKFRTVQLIDGEVQKALDKLEIDTQAVGDEMRTLDMDDVTRTVKMKQAELVKRLT